MSGYRWRGWTPRHQAIRQWADAQWEHDQRSMAQRNRQVRAAPEATSPAAGTARTWHVEATADAIRRTGATP